MSSRPLLLSLAAVMAFVISPAPAATFDYTTLWAHLSDVEVLHYSVEFGGLVDVVVKGNIAYTINDYGLQVVDCADPTSIVYRGDLALGDPLRCDIRDHYLYVLNDSPLIDVVDVDDHDDPVLLNQVTLPAAANDLLIVGPWLYVALDDDRLAILSLATGTAPELVNTVNLPAQHGERLELAGGRVVSAGNAGLAVLSVVMPDWPSVLGTIALAGDTQDLSVRDDLALVGQLEQSRLVDISDPTTIIEVATLPDEGMGVCLTSNGQAWLGLRGCWMQGGMRIYDLKEPASPQWLHDEILGFRGYPRAMVEYQGHVFAAEWVNWCAGEWAGFHIFQVGDLPGPEPLGTAGADFGRGMLVHGVQVDVGTGVGLKSWDLTAPDDPQLVQTIGGDRGFYLLAEDAGMIVAATYSYYDHSFQVVTRDAFGSLSLRGGFLLPERAVNLDVWGSLAVVALNESLGLLVIDVSDPDAPVILAELFAGEQILGVAIHHQVAVVATYQLLRVFDLTNPLEPVLLASEPHGPYWKYTDLDIVERTGRWWLLAARNQGWNYDGGFVEIFDLTDPTAPRLTLSQRQLAMDDVGEPIWHDDLLVVPGSYHLTFYRCFDPDEPVEFIGRVRMFDGWSYGDLRWAAVTPTAVATVSNYDLFHTWPLPPGVVAATPQVDPLPAPKALRAKAVPNPFNPACELRILVPMAGELKVEVFDARGRRVRTLLGGHVSTGTQAMRWDGRDTDGRPAPAGIYLARCSLNGHVASVKLTLAK
jgi:hypothetical protein